MKSFINPDAFEKLKSGNADAGFGEHHNPLAKAPIWAAGSLAVQHARQDTHPGAETSETPDETSPSEQ